MKIVIGAEFPQQPPRAAADSVWVRSFGNGRCGRQGGVESMAGRRESVSDQDAGI